MANLLKKHQEYLRDMTSGNLFLKIILFAIPSMFATIMQLLYVSIDLTTVHYGDSAESMGAIASNNALINLIVIVFTGIAIGSNVVLSEAKGADNKEKAEKVVHTSILFSVITGIIVGIVGFFVSDNLLVLMGTEEHYLTKATLYLRIYFAGLPFLMVFNYASQLLRAQGDSRTPFIALTIAGLINVGFDCLFVFPLHMGVAGVAFATIIAEGISAAICVFVLIKGKNNYVSLNPKKLRIHKDALIDILKIGLPAGLQGFFFSLPNVFIQSSLYSISPGNANLENGASAGSNVEGYFYALTDAISVAMMTFIAANVGAKKPENIKKCVLYGSIWGVIACALIALITLTLNRPILRLFVDNEEALQAGYERLCLSGYLYIFQFTMHGSAAILRGLKRSNLPMFSTLIFCTIVRIILILTLFKMDYFHTLTWLYALYPITWALATFSNIGGILIFVPKDLKRLQNTEISQ